MPNLAQTTALIELHVPDFQPVKNFYNQLGFEILREYPAQETEDYLMMKLEQNLLSF
jgi:predicted lactoylglutathione lyase